MTRPDPFDDELREAFAELTAGDRGHVSSFGDVVARQPARARSVFASPVLALAGVAAIAGLSASYLRRNRAATLVVPTEVTVLMTWRSPTDVLLLPPSWDVVRTVPNLNASILDSRPVSVAPTGDVK